jgi:precorrin isomerase
MNSTAWWDIKLPHNVMSQGTPTALHTLHIMHTVKQHDVTVLVGLAVGLTKAITGAHHTLAGRKCT